jgi:hypothetical protein
VEPRLGQEVNALRSRREQDDRQRRVEQIEEHLDLLDDGIVTAGIEEGAPVPAGRLEVVLAAGGVGEHAVEVDDHGRAGRDRSIAPCPVLGIGAAHSSSPASWFDR